MSKSKDTHIPPNDVADAAAKGLELREKFHRGGTQIGVARARDLKNKRPLSDDTIKRMSVTGVLPPRCPLSPDL